MSSVTQVEEAMQDIFGRANQRAQRSGCVQRRSKLTGEVFLQTLVLSWWQDPHASREALARMATRLGVSRSSQRDLLLLQKVRKKWNLATITQRSLSRQNASVLSPKGRLREMLKTRLRR